MINWAPSSDKYFILLRSTNWLKDDNAASGSSNKEIASTLSISERTVKNHVSNIFKKIDVSDRTQAAVFAIKNDIIKLKW